MDMVVLVPGSIYSKILLVEPFLEYLHMGFSYKQSIGLVVLYAGITFSANTNALTIINYNSRAVDYEITEAPTCANSIFNSGKLGPYEGSVNWDNPSLLDPEEHLCYPRAVLSRDRPPCKSSTDIHELVLWIVGGT